MRDVDEQNLPIGGSHVAKDKDRTVSLERIRVAIAVNPVADNTMSAHFSTY